MVRNRLIGGIASAGLGALAAPGLAQSFNIDFGDKVSLPAPTYGAIGLPGVWNSVDFLLTTPSALTPVSGPATGASIKWVVMAGGVVMPDPGTSGNDAALMDDGVWGTGDVVIPMEIENLAPGRYRVVMYGMVGGAPGQRALLGVGNAANGRDVATTIGGAWPGSFVEGVTHAQFGLTVPDGTMQVIVLGGFFGQSGYCNGMQLVKVCDADFTTGAVSGQPGFGVPNGVLNNDDFFYFLGRFAAGDLGEADVTTTAVPGSPGYGLPDGAITNDDFFYYLSLFAAGC